MNYPTATHRRYQLIGTRTGLALIVGVGLAQGLQPASGAVAGAWEAFSTQTNAAAWRVYDYMDGLEHPSLWDPAVGSDPHIYFTYAGDYALSFLADSVTGAGALTGDYQSQKIAGVSCDVYFASLTVLDAIDCAVFANGPGGEDYYYNPGYARADFTAAGWWKVVFSFDEPWYYDADPDPDLYDWVPVDPKALTNISELDVSFYPKLRSTGGSRVGIDDLRLEPTLSLKQTTSVVAGTPNNFKLTFTPAPAVLCRVEKMRDPVGSGWDTVVGQTGITGPLAHDFLRPMEVAAEFYRVASEPVYTPIVTPVVVP